jgi:hypothetical protein
MYISKSYIDLLGGKIWAENNRDKGAIVCFKIPLIKLNETEKEIPLLQAKVPEPQKLKNTCCGR